MNLIKKLLSIKIIVFFVIVLTSAYASMFWGYDASLLRTIDNGMVQGTTDNYNTHVFKGIPYAAAPVGNLRWQAPQDITPWEKVHNATEFGSICIQGGTMWGTDNPEEFGTVIGSENCLFVNVWRPNNYRKKLPVLLWIHGGSNTRGSGSSEIYNGAHLASKTNAIVVSINYRLGDLGRMFNSFADDGNLANASGNYALLDMIKSLDWIQKNIQTFGGNPDKVTIAGNSAACISVWGLLHSPLAENLFHRALCSAGSPRGITAKKGQVLSDSRVDGLLVSLGKASDLTAAAALRLSKGDVWVANFMRTVPAKVLASTVTRVPYNFIDGYVLSEIGPDAVDAGATHKVPMIIGSTKNEMTYVLAAFGGMFNAKQGASDPFLWQQINAEPATLSVADIIAPAYIANFNSIEKVLTYAWNLDTDLQVNSVHKNNPNVYRYDMNWDDVPAPWDQALGAMHTLDLPFLFGNFITGKDNPHKYAWNEENKISRERLSNQFMTYLGHFMDTGNPNAFWGLPHWPRWSNVEDKQQKTRIQFDEITDSSNKKFNYKEYQAMLNALEPKAKAIAESWMRGFGFEIGEQTK